MDDERSIIKQLERLFEERFSRSRNGSGPTCDYVFKVENLSDMLNSFDLVATFKTGQRYCCFEPGCHFGVENVFWPEFRADMARMGLDRLPRLTIFSFRCIVEKGAMMILDRDPSDPIISEAYEYTIGPFTEP